MFHKIHTHNNTIVLNILFVECLVRLRHAGLSFIYKIINVYNVEQSIKRNHSTFIFGQETHL